MELPNVDGKKDTLELRQRSSPIRHRFSDVRRLWLEHGQLVAWLGDGEVQGHALDALLTWRWFELKDEPDSGEGS